MPEAARQRLWQSYVLSDGEATGYGYGWRIQSFKGQDVIAHGGGIHGFSTMGLRMPDEQIFIAVLSNDPDSESRTGLLARQVVNLLHGKLARYETVEVDPASLEKLVGVYRIDDETIRAVTVEDGQLFSQRTGGPKQEALPLSADTFFYADDLTLARFILQITGDGDHLMAQATAQPSLEIFPVSETEFFNTDIGGRLTFSLDDQGVATGLVLEQGGQTIEAERIGD